MHRPNSTIYVRYSILNDNVQRIARLKTLNCPADVVREIPAHPYFSLNVAVFNDTGNWMHLASAERGDFFNENVLNGI